jgi:hypothetical protein
MKFKSLKFGKNKDEIMKETVVEQPDAPVAPEAELPPEPVDPAPPVEEARPAPHGPMAELTLDAAPAIDDSDEPVDFGGIEPPVTPGDDEEDVTVVEVKADELAAAKGEAVVPAEDVSIETAPEEEVKMEDSLSSLFSMDEDEVNPLAALIDSLPDVTVQELMDDIQEIKEIMQEWRQH